MGSNTLPPALANHGSVGRARTAASLASPGTSSPAPGMNVGSIKDRLIESIGFGWICCGIITYALLSYLAHVFLHSMDAERLWREQVPAYIYDRSTFIFGTALAVDLLSILFERQTIRLDYVLLPAFIKGMATTTNVIVRFASPSLIMTPAGRPAMLQRYICWMHTTPTILMLIQLISTSITYQEVLTAILWDEVMVVSGALALMTSGWQQVCWGIVTHVAMLPVLPYIYKGFSEAISQVKLPATKRLMWYIFYMNLMLWTMFAVTWDLAICNLLSSQWEEVLYLACDFSAKVLFSSTLMLSSFKGMEARRETAMRQIEESSKQKLIEELRLLLEQKERFMSSVSHELRTPLNGIIGISEGMLSGCCGVLPEQVRRQIYIIRTSGARLLALINDVMDAAALRQNKLVLKQEVVVLRHVVDDVLDLTRSLVDSEVELRNTVPPRITVLGDAGRLVQILNNLLGNAAKFTRRGFIKVSARMFDGGSRVAIMVQDTGIGIPKNKLATIFLPFEQVDMSISRKYGGFGLGLNIVQELVKAHGGEIWVESNEGQGSMFTFTMLSARSKASIDLDLTADARSEASGANIAVKGLRQVAEVMPLEEAGVAGEEENQNLQAYNSVQYNAAELAALASARPYVEDRGPSQASRSNASAVAAHVADAREQSGPSDLQHLPPGQANSGDTASQVIHGKPLHHQRYGCYQVLSVDDDMVNQNVVRTMLSSTGYEVITFQSGPDTLAHLSTCDALPDLVLLDCMMPEMDGYEVLRHLRTLFPRTHIPVIMVSARTEEDNIVQGLDCGADDYITKPFKRSEFLARVRCQLGDLDLSEDLDDEAAGQATPVVASADARTKRAAKQPILVLAIDDDEINQMILQGMLRTQNIRYIKAKSGEEGLAILEADPAHPPHLVLLDSSLPDVSGFDVCRRMRASYTKAQLPIIMLSARPNEQAIVEGLNSGANDYVTKPFRRAELMARIRLHLRARNGASASDAPPPMPLSLTPVPLGGSKSDTGVVDAGAPRGLALAPAMAPSALPSPNARAGALGGVGSSSGRGPWRGATGSPPALQLQPQVVANGLPVNVRNSWGSAGLVVATVGMPEGGSLEVAAAHIGAAFAQMADTVGLTKVEASGRTFVAAALGPDPSQPLDASSAVALLQLAQGLVDAAAAGAPDVVGPVPLHVVLHCGPATASAGVLFGPGLATAKELAAVCPPLAICATAPLVAGLVAAGMTHPQRCLTTQGGEQLLVVEAHRLSPLADAAVPQAVAASSNGQLVGGPQVGNALVRDSSNEGTHMQGGVAGAQPPSVQGSTPYVAAEKQLHALRGELSLMRQQLEQMNTVDARQAASPGMPRTGSTSPVPSSLAGSVTSKKQGAFSKLLGGFKKSTSKKKDL